MIWGVHFEIYDELGDEETWKPMERMYNAYLKVRVYNFELT